LDKIRHEAALQALPDWVKRLLAMIFQGRPPFIMLAPGLFSIMRKRGIPVWFLGINDQEQLDIAIKSGATAVLTDRVNWLCEELNKRKAQSERPVMFRSIS
jgi:glycerophosphoryl diester phosphodiesterase